MWQMTATIGGGASAMRTVEVVYRYERQAAAGRPRPADAAAARRRLDDGNRAFATLLEGLAEGSGTARGIIPVDAEHLGLLPGGPATPQQQPFAAILGCADARVPVELVFSEGPNDLFVVRVAGNVLGSEVLGSLRYAIEHLGGSLKIIAVLGHSGCGAMSAAVDVFLLPRRYLPLATDHALRSVVDRMLVGVQGSAKRLAETLGPGVVERPGYRAALIECAIAVNAAFAAYTLQHEVDRAGHGGLQVAYGVYLLDTHQVWAPRPGAADALGLSEPPRDEAAFFDLSTAIIQSGRIAAILR